MNSTQSYKPFVTNPQILDIFRVFDELRYSEYVDGGDNNMLITGESGSGKSELAKRYCLRNPVVEEKEQTVVPVVYVELKSISSVKDFAKAILVAMGDPQKGAGVRNATDMFERIVNFVVQCRTELFILDEVQTVIQNRSHRVAAGIADWFKDLMNTVKRPVVLMGMPWCADFIRLNDQLEGRVGYRYQIEPYRVSEDFGRYVTFLKKLGEYYGASDGFDMCSKKNALRLFSYSSGNVRRTVSLVAKAWRYSRKKGTKLSRKAFQESIKSYGISENDNPFHRSMDKLELCELVIHSAWIFQKAANKTPMLVAQYQRYRLDKDMKLYKVEAATAAA